MAGKLVHIKNELEQLKERLVIDTTEAARHEQEATKHEKEANTHGLVMAHHKNAARILRRSIEYTKAQIKERELLLKPVKISQPLSQGRATASKAKAVKAAKSRAGKKTTPERKPNAGTKPSPGPKPSPGKAAGDAKAKAPVKGWQKPRPYWLSSHQFNKSKCIPMIGAPTSVKCLGCEKEFGAKRVGKTGMFYCIEYHVHCIEECQDFKELGTVKTCFKCNLKFLNILSHDFHVLRKHPSIPDEPEDSASETWF